MKKNKLAIVILNLLIVLPALADDVGLHRGSAQPTRAIDVPYAPVQETVTVLAQARDGSGTQTPDYILKECHKTESTGDPRSAMRSIDPAGMLYIYFQHHLHRDIGLASIKTTLLEGAKHGKITTEVDNTGRVSYGYDPEPEYVGADKAVFMAEFEGKRYKIIVDIAVSLVVDESLSQCPEPRLIRVNKARVGWAEHVKPNIIYLNQSSFVGLHYRSAQPTLIRNARHPLPRRPPHRRP